MPIIEVKSLPSPRSKEAHPILSRVCVKVAEILEIPERSVWATWEEIPPGAYVEGEVAAENLPPDSHPPLVRFQLFSGRPNEKVEAAMVVIAETLSEELQLEPGSVFVRCEEIPPGRVYTGGKVRR